jgi:hypothetical protein
MIRIEGELRMCMLNGVGWPIFHLLAVALPKRRSAGMWPAGSARLAP